MRPMSFCRLPEVASRFIRFHEHLPRGIDAPIRVTPLTNHYAVVGTAFDYLLRFEIQRRAPHAIVGRWVAEAAPGLIWIDLGNGCHTSFVLSPPMEDYSRPDRIVMRAKRMIWNAKRAVREYANSMQPTTRDQTALARHAIRLAKLDVVPRAHRLVHDYRQVDRDDARDLVRLLGIVPFEKLVSDQPLFLNPDFGGADADIVTGDLLVDIKTKKVATIEAVDLHQLLGYVILARHRRRSDSTFPEVRRVGLYFSRHGILWETPVTGWTERRGFASTERWFLHHML
jgi:hypothetical protein